MDMEFGIANRVHNPLIAVGMSLKKANVPEGKICLDPWLGYIRLFDDALYIVKSPEFPQQFGTVVGDTRLRRRQGEEKCQSRLAAELHRKAPNVLFLLVQGF